MIVDDELVQIALNGFLKHREVFIKYVVERDHLPNWTRLWDDFVQEEIYENSHWGGQPKKVDNEENIALASKGKQKFNKGKDGGSSSKDGKKK